MGAEKTWDSEHCKIQDRVAAHIKANSKVENRVYYSAYTSDDRCHPIDNLDEVAVDGVVQFTCQYAWVQENLDGADDVYGNYLSDKITNPTWLDIALIANEMINRTGDHHHVFLEGINKFVDCGDTVPLYDLSMGS